VSKFSVNTLDLNTIYTILICTFSDIKTHIISISFGFLSILAYVYLMHKLGINDFFLRYIIFILGSIYSNHWKGLGLEGKATFKQYLIRGRERENPLPCARFTYHEFFKIYDSDKKKIFPVRTFIDINLINEMQNYSDE